MLEGIDVKLGDVLGAMLGSADMLGTLVGFNDGTELPVGESLGI